MASFDKFDKDAVSENIRTFLSTGIGSTSPQGTPQFSNRDVELHQEAIANTQTPVSANTPIGGNVSGMGVNFRSLDDPEFAGVRDVTMRIGELQGQKFENKAELTELVQSDFGVANAEQQVQILSDAMRMAGDPRKKAKLGQALQSATLIRDQAVEAATLKANAELGKRNALLDADIARLQSRKLALDEEAVRTGRANKLGFPPAMTNGIIAAGRAEDIAGAEAFLKVSPPATVEMWRQGTARFNTGNPLPYWDGLIDAGGRESYQDYIIDQVADTEKENVAVQINKMDERMDKARVRAKQEVEASLQGKKAGPKRFEFQKNPELRAQAELQKFDEIMRDANFTDFQGRLIAASPQDLDRSWFGTNDEDFELAKQLQGMLQPGLGSAEMVYTEAAKRLMTSKGISQTRALGIVGRIWDNMRNQHDTVNKPLGAAVSQKRYDVMERAMNANMFKIDQLKVDQASQFVEDEVSLGAPDAPSEEGVITIGEFPNFLTSPADVRTPSGDFNVGLFINKILNTSREDIASVFETGLTPEPSAGATAARTTKRQEEALLALKDSTRGMSNTEARRLIEKAISQGATREELGIE